MSEYYVDFRVIVKFISDILIVSYIDGHLKDIL